MNDPGVDFNNRFFRRQLRTEDDLELAIAAVQSSCVHALRYDGTDRRVVKRLHELAAPKVVITRLSLHNKLMLPELAHFDASERE